MTTGSHRVSRQDKAGKQAGRSATVPALQFKPDVVVAALVGREWLTKKAFPPENRLEGLRPFQPYNSNRMWSWLLL